MCSWPVLFHQENVKYLPGIKLGKNVVADPDIENAGTDSYSVIRIYLSDSESVVCMTEKCAVKEANMLVFVTPHQFMEGICKRLVGKVRGDAEAISLIKGMEVKTEGPCMISRLISQQLGLNCCVLMGANIASEASPIVNPRRNSVLINTTDFL